MAIRGVRIPGGGKTMSKGTWLQGSMEVSLVRSGRLCGLTIANKCCLNRANKRDSGRIWDGNPGKSRCIVFRRS